MAWRRCTASWSRPSWCPTFAQLWPEKFNNKTNGVTPAALAPGGNPGLSRLITDTIGDRWITDLDQLRELEPCADDSGFQEHFRGGQAAEQARRWPS